MVVIVLLLDLMFAGNRCGALYNPSNTEKNKKFQEKSNFQFQCLGRFFKWDMLQKWNRFRFSLTLNKTDKIQMGTKELCCKV